MKESEICVYVYSYVSLSLSIGTPSVCLCECKPFTPACIEKIYTSVKNVAESHNEKQYGPAAVAAIRKMLLVTKHFNHNSIKLSLS